MATVTGPSSFLTLRFLLGVAEAGFWPGILLYLTFWFPTRYRARAIGALYLAVPASNVVAAAISSTLLQLDGLLGLKGWQWVFIGEAVPALVLVPVVLRLLTDRPGVAAWLRPAQRDWLEAELQRERVEVERGGHLGLAQALTDPRVLTLAIVSMLHLVSLTGLTFFMPQMVKALGTSTAMAAALTAIPYVIGVIGPIAAGYSSDRLKERRWHYIGAMALAALSLICAGRVISSYWLLLATSGAALGIYASKPCFWPIPSQFLTGVGAAAGIALINSIANVGGYVGPLVVGWVKDSTQLRGCILFPRSLCACVSSARICGDTHGGPSPIARRFMTHKSGTPPAGAPISEAYQVAGAAPDPKALARARLNAQTCRMQRCAPQAAGGRPARSRNRRP
jgi:MFS transporter, ACS family, tartrate transporter